jgi:hypothetical protein
MRTLLQMLLPIEFETREARFAWREIVDAVE